MATRLADSSSTVTLADALLRQIATKIQLSQTDYGVAVDHYEAVDKFLAREKSPIQHIFGGLYPQGSMAIGATIASRLKNDEFDIDVIANLNIRADTAPGAVLDALYEAVNGEPGSIYHGKVARNSRCVTIEYDRMHLDITPAVRLPQFVERTSVIFHAHEDEPPAKHRHIVANPWGFAQWFINETPDVQTVVEGVLHKSSEPVPDQEHVLEKSVSLIALQLLKRWRNKCYDNRPRSKRCPPSVILAYYIAVNSGHSRDLYGELIAQSEALYSVFSKAQNSGQLVSVQNPSCVTDVLTDRWPGDLDNQSIFVNDLKNLRHQLAKIGATPTPEICAQVFSELLGENVTRVVMEEFAANYETRAMGGGLFSNGGANGIALGASGLAATPINAIAKPIPRHTDFGDGD